MNNEDVWRVGEYVNDAGTTVQVPNMNFQGLANKFQGTIAGIEGAVLGKLTTRGNRSATHYTRQHYQYIDLNGRRRI